MSSDLGKDFPSTVSRPAKKSKLDASQKRSEYNSETLHNIKRFACPFYKRKPQGTRVSCMYPGFSNIARLKEHLYRQHMRPTHLCSRCLEIFDSEAKLQEHARAPEPCHVNTKIDVEGITPDQFKDLKKRKRTDREGLHTDEQKWQDIYTMLFPHEAVPSAFCDTFSGTPEIQNFRAFQLEKLPTLLDAEMEKHGVFSDCREKIPDILRSCLKEGFAEWDRITGKVSPCATPTITEISSPGQDTPADDNDGSLKTPQNTSVSGPDPATPQHTESSFEITTGNSASYTPTRPGKAVAD